MGVSEEQPGPDGPEQELGSHPGDHGDDAGDPIPPPLGLQDLTGDDVGVPVNSEELPPSVRVPSDPMPLKRHRKTTTENTDTTIEWPHSDHF